MLQFHVSQMRPLSIPNKALLTLDK